MCEAITNLLVALHRCFSPALYCFLLPAPLKLVIEKMSSNTHLNAHESLGATTESVIVQLQLKLFNFIEENLYQLREKSGKRRNDGLCKGRLFVWSYFFCE